MLTVILKNSGNIDHGQNPNQRVPGTKNGKLKCFNLSQASQICGEYINQFNLGGGNWIGGQVYDEKNKQVAEISYNGRIWNMDGSEILPVQGDRYVNDSDIPKL